jgi:chromosome segregation ATPase
MQSEIVSSRLILGLVSFSLSFGLFFFTSGNFYQSFISSVFTVISTYIAALVVDKRHRNQEMTVLVSQHRRIRELEGLKSRIAREANQIEAHHHILYTETNQLQNQIIECRTQRDTLHRDIGIFAGQKKQLEVEINNLNIERSKLETNQQELQNSSTNLISEKRRLELNCNIVRSELMQLQSQIDELKQEKQEVEGNLVLLERLKPQLQDQISLLQDERDILQNQVWDLLQQVETLGYDSTDETQTSTQNPNSDEMGLFPFDELWESIADKPEDLPTEWQNFLENLPADKIAVLKAIVMRENPNAMIKQIAEANITMPNLLIDSINEIANNTIGELIIQTTTDIPEIYQEYMSNVKRMISLYENQES